ncbi:MAG: 8-amino-7-oxononanoate synthase [Phycisphaeraceae bacterium]|nr:8-amino-7-oxononanoate synthase [Phycisphaeraceae bacterium]
MMSNHPAADLFDQLQLQLDDLAARSLRRRLRCMVSHGRTVAWNSRSFINLASNDYLALSRHPHLKRAAIDAIERFGVGATASPLIVGHHQLHEQLEQRFAAFKHAEAALLFSSGFAANLAVLTSLAQRGDTILIDKLTHASLIDAARASGATVRSFHHRDYDHLATRLAKKGSGPFFVVTDSIFSMDGDAADLPAIVELAQRHGAITIVDEAHATGLYGPHGEGLAAAQGVVERIDVSISTASKALGGLGGMVCARRTVIDTIINRGRSYIYSTAPPPAQAAVILAAMDVIRDEPQRRQRVLELATSLRDALRSTPYAPRPTSLASPIVPLVTGRPDAALDLAQHLEDRGLLAVAIRPPTVAPAAARVRLSLRADLVDEDMDLLLAAVRDWPGLAGRNSP